MNIDIWLQIQNIFESITSFEMKQRHYALLLFTVLVIAIIKGRKYQPSGVSSESVTSSDLYSHDSLIVINPATGLPMMGGVDAGGNCFGFSSSSSINDDYRSSHDPHHH